MRLPVKLMAWMLVLVAAFLGLSLWSFWMAVRPPRLEIPGTPADYRMVGEEITIVADDGVRLAAWLIEPPTRRPTGEGALVILLHGYPANKSDLLPLAGALHARFAVLLVDLRAFGDSGGRATTLGLRERGDLRRVVDAAADRGYTRIGVFGYSLGGAVALMAAADDRRIRAVAAWAPFADLRLLARDIYGMFWLLKYPFVELMILWGRLAFGADLTRPSPEEASARLAIPVQLWASRGDEQIPFVHAERLRHALARNPRAEFQFGAGAHNDRVDGFERRLAEFFARALD
jgi:pimeloyl-ACP methyl ester carboxylesterase